MTNQAYPAVDGDECSWAEIALECNIPGGAASPISDCESIKWSSKVEVGVSRGTSGGRVMKTTAGEETNEASIVLTRSGLQRLREILETAAIALGKVRGDEVILSAVRFDVMIQHTPLGVETIYQTKLSGCRYLGDADDMKQGNEADKVEVTLNPIRIARKSATGNWLVLR